MCMCVCVCVRRKTYPSCILTIVLVYYTVWLELSTIVVLPWLEHTNEDDHDHNQKYEYCNAHPFSRALLQTLCLMKGPISRLHMFYSG